MGTTMTFREKMEFDFAAMQANPYALACREAGVPLPPPDCVLDENNGEGVVFDWRYPPNGEGSDPSTPISFRWRFQDGKLVTFAAYGWHKRDIGYGRSAKDPEWGYSILPQGMRDEAARRELPTDVAT
jgi:hypothetical protein